MIWFLEKFDFFKKQEIRFTSYNQVFQELENHHSLSAQNIGGINVFIIKLDDFIRFQRNIPNQNNVITVMRREMHRLSESLVFRAQSMDTTSFIVTACHDTDITMKKFGLGDEYTKLRNDVIDSFRTRLAGIPNIHLILEQDIAQILPVYDYYDPIADEKGHIPYVFEYYNALGYLLARKIFDTALLVHKPLKAIILDCDNTLWKGICGEVGAENIEVAASYRFLQYFMKDQKEKGVLLCLCSKNNEKDVLDVFNCSKYGMVLKLEDIAAYRINWNSKSSNVRELLDFLGFSEQNVVFIDDREDECREVQEKFSDILIVQLPDENNIPPFLKNLWIFDHIKQITAEDKNRTAIYQKKFYLNSDVKSDSGGVLDQSSFDAIVGLIELNAENIEFPVIQRVVDLTSRTNQFNLAKKIYSESQIISFIEKKSFCVLLADVKDNCGNDYGLTGLVIFRISDKNLIVDTFLLSCRVIGKNLERMMLSRLVEVAKQNNLTSISIPFIPTDRNKPAEYFLRSIVNIYEKNNSTE
ncbi:MAG TPA: HAD-IIIC family phosphatase, partial [Candidatus Babeliales bacterium]|nr:HAD-IIIC family phosphatase [Candidatus Babeliales bacterium]